MLFGSPNARPSLNRLVKQRKMPTILCHPKPKKRKNAKVTSVLPACLKASKTRLMMKIACTAAMGMERRVRMHSFLRSFILWTKPTGGEKDKEINEKERTKKLTAEVATWRDMCGQSQ